MFQRLAQGNDVWVRADITEEAIRQRFDRVAERLGVTSGRITREQFIQFTEQQQAARAGGGAAGGAAPGAQGPVRPPIVRLEEKLDRIMAELRTLEKQLADERARSSGQNPR
jgi:hypothetical protein